MRTKPLSTLILLLMCCYANAADDRVYDLAVHVAAKGKQAGVLEKVRDLEMKVNERAGMPVIAVFVPVDGADERVFVFSVAKDRKAYDAARTAATMLNDDEKKIYTALKAKNGDVVATGAKATLLATDFSPSKFEKGSDRVFELRTYLATKGNLPALQSRFRDHTLKLFEKHGMANIAYFSLSDPDDFTQANLVRRLAPEAGKKEFGKITADNALIYLLAHKDQDAAKKSFDTFRKDPDWIKARTESEAKGSLTEKDGVISLFLKPAGCSPLK